MDELVYSERRSTHTLLPDPDARSIVAPLISVDDHLVEPPHVFESRGPRYLRDQMPRIVEKDGAQFWAVEDHLEPILGGNATSGRPVSEWDALEPLRYEDMRRGCWDVDARVADMDACGVTASLCFPSMVFGFAGQRYATLKDPALGRACVDAYNDWMLDEWAGSYPDRLIPCGLVWLNDVEIAAQQVYANSERGMHAVSFSENPEKLGYPTIHSGYWDPFIRACADTETVINLHIGSSSETIWPSSDSPMDVINMFFELNGLIAAGDWLYSRVAARYPNVKIVMSEGGIGWVAMLLDRLDYQFTQQQDQTTTADTWKGIDITPAEMLLRNFWFCTFWDPTAFRVLDRIGAQNVLLEVDYPHPDSTWPDSQAFFATQLDGISRADRDLMMFGNAASVYQHQVANVGPRHGGP